METQTFANCKVINWRSQSESDEDSGIDVSVTNTAKKYWIEIPQCDIKDEIIDLEIQVFEPQLSVMWNASGPLRIVFFQSADDFNKFRETSFLTTFAAKNKIKFDDLQRDHETVAWLLGYPNNVPQSELDDAEVQGMEWDAIPATPGVPDRSLIAQSCNRPVGDNLVASTIGSTVGLFSPKGPSFDVRGRDELRRESGASVHGKGALFSPSGMIFHDQDHELVMLDDQEDDDLRRQLHSYKIEKGVVETFKCTRNQVETPFTLLSPVAKGERNPDQYILAGNRSELILVDRRVNTSERTAGRFGNKTGSRPAKGLGINCTATDGMGHVVCGLEGGQIRCYKSILDQNEQQRAVTLLVGTGDEINHIDITQEGSWILATCEYKLLLIPTRVDPKATSGPTVFEKSQQPNAIILQLTYDDAVAFHKRFGDTRFTKARFDTISSSATSTERVITTSVGSIVITWNLRTAKNSKGEYRTREVTTNVVDTLCEHGDVFHTDVLLPGHLERISRRETKRKARATTAQEEAEDEQLRHEEEEEAVAEEGGCTLM